MTTAFNQSNSAYREPISETKPDTASGDIREGGDCLESSIKRKRQRTLRQNRSIHLFCEMLAEGLNDAGYDMKRVFEVKTVDVPWTKESVKACLWKPIQDAMFEVESTAKLERTQVSKVYEVLNRHITSNFGVHVPFPEVHHQNK